MPKTNETAASEIAHDLVASEQEIDLALTSSARLLATVTQARIDTSAPFATGQSAIMRLVKALGALTEARADMARVHGDLRKIGEERCDLVFPNECTASAVEDGDKRIRLVA